MRRIGNRWRKVAGFTLVMGMLATTALPATAAPTVTPVADGFVGPLGLTVRDNGSMFVAESFAGQLTKIRPSGSTKVVYSAPGSSISGVAAGRGKVLFTETRFPEEGPAIDTTLERLLPNGRSRTVTSLQDYEEHRNPDRKTRYGFLDASASCLAKLPEEFQPYSGIVESNPYAVAIDRGRHRRADRGTFLVADAAGNSIVRVTPGGKKLSTVAVLPPIKQKVTAEMAAEFGLDACVVGQHYHGEGVPTDVEVGPDGHYYVSSLPGMPEAPGAGSVWRIHATTGKLTRVAGGLSGAVDLAVAKDGRIYVAEIFADRVSVIGPTGEVSTFVELPSPGAVEVTAAGRIYATTGVFGENGAVVRLRP